MPLLLLLLLHNNIRYQLSAYCTDLDLHFNCRNGQVTIYLKLVLNGLFVACNNCCKLNGKLLPRPSFSGKGIYGIYYQQVTKYNMVFKRSRLTSWKINEWKPVFWWAVTWYIFYFVLYWILTQIAVHFILHKYIPTNSTFIFQIHK